MTTPTKSVNQDSISDAVSFYDMNAEILAARYEALEFADIHCAILNYLPDAPGLILDVGAGWGTLSCALAEIAGEVVALESALESASLNDFNPGAYFSHSFLPKYE